MDDGRARPRSRSMQTIEINGPKGVDSRWTRVSLGLPAGTHRGRHKEGEETTGEEGRGRVPGVNL